MDRSAPVSATSSPGLSSILALQVGALVVSALYLARDILIPITLAILLSFILAPLVSLLRQARLGRVPSVLLSVVISLGIISGLGTVIGSQVSQLAGNIPQYAATVETKVDTVRSYAFGRLTAFANGLGRQAGSALIGERVASAPSLPVDPERAPTSSPRREPPAPASPNSPVALAERYLWPILSPLATIGIVFVVTIFVLMQQEDLRDRLIRLFGATDLHRTTAALDDAGRRLSKYFLTQLAVNTTFGVLIGVGLLVIGLPNPVLWGILSGLLRFVPYIGSILSAGLPVALAAAIDPGWSLALWTAALYICVELPIGQAIEPLLYGHSTGLSPLAVVVSAIFWSWLWGPLGLLLSMPLTLCLVVLGRYVDRLEFLDVLLGDQPALTPVESFYQRVLAGDADETQDHAEILLKAMSLTSYYDEVALKGLQLAAADAERGVLQAEQLERVKRTVAELVAALASHKDSDPAQGAASEGASLAAEDERKTPSAPIDDGAEVGPNKLAPEWRTSTPVLCLAGQGPLDEAASAMLAQLLGKHGLGARIESYRSASRNDIATLDETGVIMVCVSYLDIHGSPSHLRFLLRRLREKLPKAVILVGLWPEDDAALTDGRTRTLIGADYYSASLRQAVRSCTDAARTPTLAHSIAGSAR